MDDIIVSREDFETKYVSRFAYDEIRAELAAARARIAELEQTGYRDIPVSERLPEHDMYVLAFRDRGNIILNEWVIARLTQTRDDEDEWRSEDNHYVDDVTHWRPLPEPPK